MAKKSKGPLMELVTDVPNKLRLLAVQLINQSYDSSAFIEHASILEQFTYHKTIGKIDLYIDHISKIALHLSSKTYSGFYSLTFNHFARRPMLDVRELNDRWLVVEYFPELYNNPWLTPEELSLFKHQHSRELQSMVGALRQAYQDDLYQPQFLRINGDRFLEDLQSTDLYSQHYNSRIIEERLTSSSNIDFPTYSCPLDSQLIIDKSPQGLRCTYCIQTKELLISVIKDRINPLTGVRYSKRVSDLVIQKFSVELKLVCYFCGTCTLEPASGHHLVTL